MPSEYGARLITFEGSEKESEYGYVRKVKGGSVDLLVNLTNSIFNGTEGDQKFQQSPLLSKKQLALSFANAASTLSAFSKQEEMASSITAATKVGHIRVGISRRSTWNPRLVVAGILRCIQASSHQDARARMDKTAQAVKQGADEAMKNGGNMKHKAASTAEQMNQNAKEMVGKVAETAQDISENPKQTMQGAGSSAKDSAEKVKESVMGNAEPSKEAFNQNA